MVILQEKVNVATKLLHFVQAGGTKSGNLEVYLLQLEWSKSG